MKTFIFAVIVGLAATFLVVTNAAPVPLHFLKFTLNVPLPFILTFPTGIALICFALYHSRQMGKHGSVVANLEHELLSEQNKLLELAKRTHELELENRKQKIRLGEVETDADENSM